MRSILLMEFWGTFRRLHISLPIIILPSIILYFSTFFPVDRPVFLFSSVFILQLLLLISPILSSELLRGGWRLLYQAGIFNKTSKITLLILLSPIPMITPTVFLFTIVYFLLLPNSFWSSFKFVSLLMIGILSYSLGTFFKGLVGGDDGALIACLTYEAFLLPSFLASYLYPNLNALTTLWPGLMLMNSIIDIMNTQPRLELAMISSLETLIIYFLLSIASSWLLTRRVNL